VISDETIFIRKFATVIEYDIYELNFGKLKFYYMNWNILTLSHVQFHQYQFFMFLMTHGLCRLSTFLQ